MFLAVARIFWRISVKVSSFAKRRKRRKEEEIKQNKKVQFL
jgi:hypothetical protein